MIIMPRFKTLLLGLAIFTALTLSIVAYTSPGKRLARLVFRKSDLRLQAIYSCPEQFERLSEFSKEIKNLQLSNDSEPQISLISDTDDQRLADLIFTFQKKLANLEVPINDEEHIYSDVRVHRIARNREPLRKKYFDALKTEFPELMRSCIENLGWNIKACEVRFPTNYSAQGDCETFYSRRIFWSMVKKTPLFHKISPEQRIFFEKVYEQSFDEAMKKQVLTKDPY